MTALSSSVQETWTEWRQSNEGPEMMKGWKDLGLFSLEERRLKGMSLNTWKESAKRREPGYLQWCLLTGPNWDTEVSFGISGNTFLGKDNSTDTDCPERLWTLHSWRSSKAIPMQTVLGGPFWVEVFYQMTLEVPFNLKHSMRRLEIEHFTLSI